ncbi:MAG: hypothetical protein V4735_01945 [Pseudomonadota bacterium]
MEQDPRITPPEPPKRPSLFGESTPDAIVRSVGISLLVDGVLAIFHKSFNAVQIAKNAAFFGAIGAGLHLLFRKPAAAQPPVPPHMPPPAAPPPAFPQHLALANVPQILDLLVAQGSLTAPQQAQVLGEIKTGRTGFAGEIAIADGFITRDILDAALLTQAALKTEAAVADITTIINLQPGTLIAVPAWLRANWGNNGVNPAASSPSRADGAAAAANIAQNLVMIAASTPDKTALPGLQQGIVAAANLARGIANGNSAQVPLAKMAATWRQTMNTALMQVQTLPNRPLDSNGQPIDITSFISARNAEITTAVVQTLQAPPPGKGAGR